jgi:hypothetical protein
MVYKADYASFTVQHSADGVQLAIFQSDTKIVFVKCTNLLIHPFDNYDLGASFSWIVSQSPCVIY